MDFFRRAAGQPAALGVMPGTFNPVTVAHIALAQSALHLVDEVVFVLPRVLPHKEWSGASFDDRAALLMDALAGQKGFSIARAEGGLFIEIAEECRAAYSPDVQLSFLCGADAAERIANWDYGDPAAFERMLSQFDLLVAERPGGVLPARCRQLPLDPAYRAISATEVRESIARGGEWEHLVPPSIHGRVRRIYGATGRR
jgi:nicotinate-nucleotide adenylyltransferase